MRAKQAVKYHIVFHPIRRTDTDPGGEPLWPVTRQTATFVPVCDVTVKFIKQAAPENDPSAFHVPIALLGQNNLPLESVGQLQRAG
ncbi:MAG: hypothetical protein JOZ31_02095 [Verrucomicrobia bacterium]|nr:hypothetical protein [Verrucomicrobiota bacterium]MBV8483561.1 hypothetical protein [Verrucomicrobiota bacterium]